MSVAPDFSKRGVPKLTHPHWLKIAISSSDLEDNEAT